MGMVASNGCSALVIRSKLKKLTMIGHFNELNFIVSILRNIITNALYLIFAQVMTLNPVCESVETAQGVPLTVTGVAQVKIMKNADLLQTASEQFLGKKEHEIKSTVLQTLEGHLRAILGNNRKCKIYSRH